MDYYALPADAAISTADDADVELAPDIEPIITLSIAYWWLTSERSTANYDRHMDEYKLMLANAKRMDAMNKAVRHVNYNRISQGYNKGYRNNVVRGYTSQR